MDQQQFTAARDPRPVTDSAETDTIEAPGCAWMVRRSSWLLLPTLPLGVTTSLGFMYIGLAGGCRRWVVAAVVYLIATITTLELADSWMRGLSGPLWLAIWWGGFAHACVVNRRWLQIARRHDLWAAATLEQVELPATPPAPRTTTPAPPPTPLLPVRTRSDQPTTGTGKVPTVNLGIQLGGYPGRGLIVHVDPAGQLGWLYFVTGRSESSRNRQAVRLDDCTLAVAPISRTADAQDPLRHYVCARPLTGGMVIGNGDHVGSIADRIETGTGLAAAIGDLEPEPDPPINTPRIAAVVTNEPQLAAVHLASDGISRRVQPVRLTPGAATVLTTYAGEATDPVGSAPLAVAPEAKSFDALADDVWNALHPDLRVLLLTGRTATLDDVTLISASGAHTI